MSKGAYAVLVVGVLILMSSYLVSAGIGDWFRGITGRASTTGEANATVTLSGSNAVVVLILNETLIGTVVDPSEAGARRIEVNVSVYDADGAADINDSSVDINVTRGAELVKYNSTCGLVSTGTYAKNFTCHFDMWYFEEAGLWTISASANDFGTKTYIMNETTFGYDTLQAMVIAPNLITWPGISPTQENITSDNDPMEINNTGNYNIDNLTITGYTLIGVDTPSYNIEASNFTADIETGDSCSGADCVECGVDATSGATLVNGTLLDINGAICNRGNLSIGGGSGQENLYFCMPYVPENIVSQSYSTTESEEWVIGIGL